MPRAGGRMSKKEREWRRANYRLIEAELRVYPITKALLEEAERDIIEGTSIKEVAVQQGPGDPTAAKALKLTGLTLTEVGRRVGAITKALEVFKRSEELRKVRSIEMKYFEGYYTDQGLALNLGVAESTVRRWRREFIKLVAEYLGWPV